MHFSYLKYFKQHHKKFNEFAINSRFLTINSNSLSSGANRAKASYESGLQFYGVLGGTSPRYFTTINKNNIVPNK